MDLFLDLNIIISKYFSSTVETENKNLVFLSGNAETPKYLTLLKYVLIMSIHKMEGLTNLTSTVVVCVRRNYTASYMVLMDILHILVNLAVKMCLVNAFFSN